MLEKTIPSLTIPGLKKLFWDNRPFFIGFGVFMLVALLLLLFIEKGAAIFYLSNQRTAIADWVFKFGTKLGEPYLYLAAVVFLIFQRYRSALSIPLIGLSAMLMSFGSKEIFNHDRPMLFFNKLGVFDQINTIEGIALHGGTTSFPSGHTMSAFALFTFLALCYSGKKLLDLLFLGMATIVAVSRIYLVQHFLQDVIFGAVLGLGLGVLWYFLQFKLPAGKNGWMDGDSKSTVDCRKS